MSLSIRVKFILLVGVPIVLIGAMMPIVSTVQHRELLDAADDQVQEAERAFWAEMQDDLADLHLAARIIASSEETRRALRVGDPNVVALPTHATITAEVRPGSPNRYLAAKWEKP